MLFFRTVLNGVLSETAKLCQIKLLRYFNTCIFYHCPAVKKCSAIAVEIDSILSAVIIPNMTDFIQRIPRTMVKV